jgi:hypothetical protein
MARVKAQYITREDLEERLREEMAELKGQDSAWWSEHRVEPFEVKCRGRKHFAVAVSGPHVLVFFDDEDEFGAAYLGPGASSVEGELYGDLVNANRGVGELERSGSSEP